jgi:hypothetical protein
MQKVIIAASLFIFLAACKGDGRKSAFELKGNFTNSKGETIYLEKLSSTQPIVVDSALINDAGEFEFIQYQPKIGFYEELKQDEYE